ncbi:hypothetical protein ACP4OV_001011 [Aristida adscensionis]
MDCEPKGTNDAAAAAAGSSSPGGVLPLGELMLAVPECTDPELTECARDTVNLCVVEATVRLALKAADESVRGGRRVVSAEDMARAIEGLTEEDTALGAALLEMTRRLMAGRVLLRRASRTAAQAEAGGPRGGGGGGRCRGAGAGTRRRR